MCIGRVCSFLCTFLYALFHGQSRLGHIQVFCARGYVDTLACASHARSLAERDGASVVDDVELPCVLFIID